MPAQRIKPGSGSISKPLKTERTHEENQERAYVAASRRSDRSLEARVESARRASEVHKKRTGRALRITEEEVASEEMYEEEHDELPLPYRHLTTHLQTGSPEFNRRLSAYLTNHVAMRSAMREDAIHASYAQQFPNAPQYYHPSMFPSPFLPQQTQQIQTPQTAALQTPSLNNQRHQPYTTQSPRMQQQGFSLTPHHRSNSSSQILSGSGSGSSDQGTPAASNSSRSMSMSAEPASYTSPAIMSPAVGNATTPRKPSFPPGSFSSSNIGDNQFMPPPWDEGTLYNGNGMSAFSTQLPAESQAMLGGTLNQNDPLTAMLMAGSNNLPGNTYNFNTSQPQQRHGKQAQQQSVSSGLNSTLAMSASQGEMTPSGETPFDANPTYFDNAMIGKDGLTPGLNDDWESWINDGQWDVSASQ